MVAYDPYCPRCNPDREGWILCEGHRRPIWPFTHADLFRLAKLAFVFAVLTFALLRAAFEFAASPPVTFSPRTMDCRRFSQLALARIDFVSVPWCGP